MTIVKSNQDFSREVNCLYQDKLYAARDNGAVFRYPRDGSKPRLYDNQWTFGKPNVQKAYMEIASVPVHRIIATAFHGEPPTKEHVVDHVDTNRQNNRPENLRWITRLEQLLLNPITAKRIAIICGSVEAFVSDPSKFRDAFQEPNFKWMGTVSVADAKISYERLLAWSGSDQLPSGGSLDRWIFNRNNWLPQHVDVIAEAPEIIMAMPQNAAQRNWKIPSEFPCCPQEITSEPIEAYAERLKTGSVFCHNDVYASLVSKYAISDDRQSLYVLTDSSDENAIKPWALAQITYENGLFVHANLGAFFNREGAEKQYSLVQGLHWSGGDSIDDYC